MLETVHYTDLCVLTDLELDLHSEAGWHPSYLNVFDPRDKQKKLVVLRRIPEEKRRCMANTTLSLAPNGQSLTCNGGPVNTCGYRILPDKGQMSPPVFIIFGQFDPNGTDHLVCASRKTNNSFSLSGSYYHAFVKMATCDKPQGKHAHLLLIILCSAFRNVTLCLTKLRTLWFYNKQGSIFSTA